MQEIKITNRKVDKNMSKGKKKMKLVASALAIGAGVAAVNALKKKNGEIGRAHV